MVTEFLRSIFAPAAPAAPSEEEREWRGDQKRLLQEQISVNKQLNRITKWSAVAMAIPAFVGLVSLYFISETLKATQIQADAAKAQATAAEISIKIARESFDETVKNFQLDQRAWVGPIEIPTAKIAAAPVIFNVVFMNSGKSPAIKLQASMSGRFMHTTDKFSPIYERAETVPSAAIIHPGMRVRFPSTEMPFTQERIDAIKTGDLTFYLFGKFSYDDIFRIKRGGTFCVYVRRTLENIYWCPTYNESN